MKKSLSFIVLTLMGMSLMAKPVDPTVAVRVAQNFAATQVKMADNTAKIVYTHPMPESGQPAMYVVNVGPSAFVIVAADDIAHPVLGYSMARPWPVLNGELAAAVQLPSQVSGFLDDLASQIQAAQQQNITQDRETATEWQQLQAGELSASSSPLSAPDSVGPLLTTTWDQGQYYNALCPEDANGPDGHALTGCVATAMAQIINYWGYPIHGRGIHSYNHFNYGTLTVNYDSANYDYANMPSVLTATSTPQQVNAVAQLMRDCGVAANMGYGPTESSSYDVDARAGMINFFRISPDASYAEKAYFTDDEWSNMLRTDLGNNRVVMYSGHGTGGHTFVCDGYNANDYYHFNFGWSGYSDGWYTTSALNPAGMDFSSSQTAILGIAPDGTGNVILGQMAGTSTFIVDEPLEFYHLMGHNAYEGTNYSNISNSNVVFIPANNSNQLVADIIEFEDQNITINDGQGTWLKDLHGGSENDLSPVVSLNNALNIVYSGLWYYAGFKLIISQDEGCRMVSNIVASVDTTTVHLMWIENGSATQWQIEYGTAGFSHGDGTMVTLSSNNATISNLVSFTQYDFYIRSICDDSRYGIWNQITLLIEAPYWQDVVTTQPVGYMLNEETNTVEISSAEGLAWWARNGCNYSVFLTTDIDLSGYKWRPTKLNGSLNGQGHIIDNLYVNENSMNAGLFSESDGDAIIENIGIKNAYVKSTSYNVGALVGIYYGSVRNCYVTNSFIDGGDYTGGLIGESQYGKVTNCFVNASVIGNRWTGLLIGNSWQGINRNCYAAGTVRHRSYCYIAGIAAYAGAGEISNCYSVETEMGVVGYKGTTIISDTSTIVRTNSSCTLMTPIVFDDVAYTDLLTVLNMGVSQINDSIYCTWMPDTGDVNGGYPIFGHKYQIQCPNVSNVLVQNIKIGDQNAVEISWTDNGEADAWTLRYRRHDMPNSTYGYVNLNSNPDTIYEIPLGYAYDFGIRADCDSAIHSGWIAANATIVDLIYWTDLVTAQPAGFIVDDDGNVEISSAEGLAWLAVMVNGLHGQEPNSFSGKIVRLTADISLEGYRWNPIGGYADLEWRGFGGLFDGQNHSVSNLYVNDAYSNLGLFGHLRRGRVRNVVINGGYVASIYTDSKDSQSLHSSAVGGLVGFAMNCYEISNCHSSATVYANGGAGSLCGDVSNYGDDDIGVTTKITNCSASGTVYGRSSCGGLIGSVYGEVLIRNSFSTGNVDTIDGGENLESRGGLIGLCQYSVLYNSFSIGEVIFGGGKIVGQACNDPVISYVYALDSCNDNIPLIGGGNFDNTIQFHHNVYSNTLLYSLIIANTHYFDLVHALNAWVSLQNEPELRTWVIDSVKGYPAFGSFFEPTCYNPTNLTLSQATEIYDTIVKTQLTWSQVGLPDHWEILYVLSGQSLDSGTIVTVFDSSIVLTDVIIGHPLDFYVRAVCSVNDVSQWCGPVTYLPDKLRWTEVVTSQPEGYQEDEVGNVYISSAEGLAWLASVVNGLNGNSYEESRFWGKRVELMSDIDLSAYRWTAIGLAWSNCLNNSVFNGNNHSINGLYCNELADYQGLFGCYWGGDIKNIILHNSRVLGKRRTGSIVGFAKDVNMLNCAAEGNVYGIEEVGGLAGRHESGSNAYLVNSYFIGEVVARRDVSMRNALVGYVGGICGTPFFDSIVNCYMCSEISNGAVWSGIITGTGARPNTISNCYYKGYETPLSVTSENCSLVNVSSFSGSDTIWTLNTPPYVNGAFRADLVDALNAWVDANDTAGIYRRWAADSANVNGGFPVFAAIPCITTTGSDSITVCDSYTWHENAYTIDTVLVDTISNMMGCDSIVTHYLTVNHSSSGVDVQTACDSYIWIDSNTYTESDFNSQFLILNSLGCDSTVTLHLTINHSTTGDTTAVACDSFTLWNTNYTNSTNEATHTLTNIVGCDSTVTLHLTINHSTSGDTTAVACGSFTWWNTNYTNSTNEATHTLTNAAGCDSVVTLHLTINNSTTGDTTVVACDSFTWWNTNYTNSTNDATHTLTNIVGCDSTVTLHLTVNNPVHTATTEAACETYTWNGTAYTVSGDYTYSHLDNNGCMQVDTLHLTINNPIHTATTEVTCESYTWNGTAYAVSGDYTYGHTDNNGCTQVDTLHLTINNPVHTATIEAACESYTWNGTAYAVSGDYTYSHLDNNGCTQVDTLHLTINNPVHTATTEAACETYTWNETAYTVSGDYSYVHADNNGCTQVDTLHLTINNPVHTATTEAACETYTWNGTAYTISGDYTYSQLDNNGCTQVDTLHLTVNHSTTGDTAAVVCDSFTWHGTTYTAGGAPAYQTINAAGCDSVVTLHLTINHSTTGVDVQTACDSYTWIDGNTYTESNFSSQFSILNSLGCDSTVTLNLTINHSVTFYDTLTIGSNELPYDYYGNSIDGQGNFTFEGTTSEGCDSTTHLFVIVNQVGIGDVQTADGITLFPNPTRGTVTVCGSGLERVEVMDVVGRTMLVVECQRDSEMVDLSELPQGAYVVRIIAENGTAVRRVVKR